MNRSSLLSHVEINVSDYAKSIRFYDLVLKPIGWERFVCSKTHTVYSDGFVKLILSPTHPDFKEAGFHRKRTGLNHLAFYARSKSAVNEYFRNVLTPNGIRPLYESGPFGDDEYYAVFFEDPDKMKVEVVYAPKYWDKTAWPNNIVSDFDPDRES